MELINLTPHAIKIVGDDGETIAIVPPSGNVARVATTMKKVGSVGGIELYAQEVGETCNLPDASDEALLIVSALVRLAHPERKDLASPGELVRNESGQPTGCRGLVINR